MKNKYLSYAIVLCLLSSCTPPETQDFSVVTIAGSALSSGSLDGTGTSAKFYNPCDLTADGSNLYVCDTYNKTIRRVELASLTVTTLAGSAGVRGSIDGIGNAARFRAPCAITADGPNLYVCDSSNNSIRRIVTATREVTTLAGSSGNEGAADGIGTAAQFTYPSGIDTDGTNLYVCDTNNQTIRQIVIATAFVTTLAGSAGNAGSSDGTGMAARFYNPVGITMCGPYLYVCDCGNSTIRRITAATGEVTTFAGTALQSGTLDGIGTAARFNYPTGLTTDGVNLYVSDNSNHAIRKVVIATGEVTTLAGGLGNSGYADGSLLNARFNYPAGLTVNGAFLYVCDSANHVIRQVTP